MAKDKEEKKKWDEMTDDEKDALSDREAIDSYMDKIIEEGNRQ